MNKERREAMGLMFAPDTRCTVLGVFLCYAARSIKKACRIISTEEMVAGAKRCYNI